MSRGVVILKIGENRGNIWNIFGIKYKILLPSKFKNNIPYKLNIICEIRFLEIIFTIQEIIRKSKVNSILKIFFSTGKEIIPKLYGPEEQGGPTRRFTKFLFPVQPVVYPAVQSFDRVIPHWKRGPGPSRIFPARPVIIPSNTRRQPRA